MKRSDTSSFAMYGSVNVASKPAQNVEEKNNSISYFLYMSILFAQLSKQTKRAISMCVQ
jgi:hypothetical protein